MAEPALGKVLIADDEPSIVAAFARALQHAGYSVERASNGKAAVEQMQRTQFDAVISDISMPELDGIGLLRVARECDLDLPVILVTGSPSLATAQQAIEFGALRYLSKPVALPELLSVVEQVVRVGKVARTRRRALDQIGDTSTQLADRAGLEARFSRALSGLWMAYQPIVHFGNRRVFAYEALMRSTEATLPHPGAVLDAAQRLGKLPELGRAVRSHVAMTVSKSPIPLALVNLHPEDLNDEELYSPDAPLSKLASRVVLEVTERASLDEIDDLQTRVSRLRALGYSLAVDDIGGGYAGLTSIAQLQPEIMKIDMALVRDVDVDSTRQKLIGAMVSLCKEMNGLVIAEGIETRTERDTVARLGCDLMQGYLFAKPGEPFPEALF